MTTIPKFTSDTAAFRWCVKQAGFVYDTRPWCPAPKAYNDAADNGQRRIKIAWNLYKRESTIVRLGMVCVQVFGARFVEADYTATDELFVRLDDTKGAPFKPEGRVAKPVLEYKRPAWLTDKERAAFWRKAFDLPAGARVRYNRPQVLKRDINVFKKAMNGNTQVIINLVIPAGAKVNPTSYKCRASSATVHSIVGMRSGKEYDSAYSDWDNSFKYHKGKTAVPFIRYYYTNPDEKYPGFFDGPGECRSGIHFFVDINDALDW